MMIWFEKRFWRSILTMLSYCHAQPRILKEADLITENKQGKHYSTNYGVDWLKE
jgi:hypothetical protein